MDKVLGTRPTTAPLNLVDTGELYTEIERDQGIKKVFNKIRERGEEEEGGRREGDLLDMYVNTAALPRCAICTAVYCGFYPAHAHLSVSCLKRLVPRGRVNTRSYRCESN